MDLPRLQCSHSPIILLQQEGHGLNHDHGAVYWTREALPGQALRVLAAEFGNGRNSIGGGMG